MKAFALLLAPLLLTAVAAAPSCDAEYGAHCPSAMDTGELIECLNKVDGVSDDCKAWLAVANPCLADITGDGACGDQPSNDAWLCLTAWKKPHDLTDECAAALPKPKEEAPKKGRKSKAAKKRAKYKRAMEELERRKKEDAAKEKRKAAKEAGRKRKKKKRKRKKKRSEL